MASKSVGSTAARLRVTVLLVVALFVAACSGQRPTVESVPTFQIEEPTTFPGLDDVPPIVEPPGPATTVAPMASPTPDPNESVEYLIVEVIESFPHDPAAFTQGLLVDGDVLLESTGQRYESDLRRVQPDTGDVLQIVSAPGDFFAEGLTKVGDELIQLTWRAQQALVWDATTFELKRTVGYPGEGWGLCYDGDRLVMSDGTPDLVFRVPETFDELGRVRVTFNGAEVHNLNELECVDGKVWANIWQTDLIVRIDPTTGRVEAAVDASSLQQPRTEEVSVLNGIAYDPANDSFFVTGKYWPTMYRVTFVPNPEFDGRAQGN